MDSFYFIILAIAIVILILVLAVIGWMMTKNVQSQKFPGITTTCPDFWTINADGTCKRPDAGQINRGSTSLDSAISDTNLTPGGALNSFDPNNAEWSKSGDPICEKRKWANLYGVKWDTVVNSSVVC